MPDVKRQFQLALTSAAAELGAQPLPEVVVEQSALAAAGDYSSPVAFRLAPLLRRPPAALAEQLAERVRAAGLAHVAEVTVSGQGYVNLRLELASYAGEVISDSLEIAAREVVAPGVFPPGKVVVEHTATNPNKAAHVGHLRNACIGDTVARLLRACGCEVEVQNYIDDTGVQVADVLVGISHLGLEPTEDEPFDHFCSRAYVEVCSRYEQQPELLAVRTDTLRKIEARQDPVAAEAKRLAERIVKAHLATMARAGVSYDLLTWESDIIELGFLRHALDLMLETGVVRRPESGPLAGCWVLPQVDGEPEELQQGEAKVLVKSDGLATYTGKDIAYHLWKFGVLGLDFHYRLWAEGGPATTAAAEEVGGQLDPARFGHATRVVNVIDQRQSAPQLAVREALRRLGFADQASRLWHLGYEVVALSPSAAAALGVDTGEGKRMYAMSGRQGIDVGADALLDEAERQVQEKARDQAAAAGLAASAVRYYLLRFGLNSIITFDFGEALRTTGDTGVYLQYAHARACGILRRVDPLPLPEVAPELSEAERALLKLLDRFPEVVRESAEELSPVTLAGYAFDLASGFSGFYEHTERLYQTEDEALRGLRRGLVDASRAVLARTLQLMGMVPLQRV